MYASSGRGGGGFRPRSTHQAGGDGPSRGGRSGGRGGGPAKPKMRVACSAQIAVPELQRAMIIGRGGSTIKELQAKTAARVNVPGRDRPAHHLVRVEAEDIANVLHLCWELTELGIGRDEPVECTVVTWEGTAALVLHRYPSGEFLSGSGLSAFCITTCCSREELDVFIDNERFARPEVSAACLMKQCAEVGAHILFIYGHSHEEPKALFDGLKESIRQRAAEVQIDSGGASSPLA